MNNYNAFSKGVWGRKTFCLVSGASQGIGRQICINFAEEVGDGSVFLLIARNKENLNQTKELMEQKNFNIKVVSHSVDLYNPEDGQFMNLITSTLECLGTRADEYDLSMIVHNAGSLGDLTKSTKVMDNLQEWRKYFDLNLFSTAILNSDFLKVFSIGDGLKPEICIVNITSLCAVKPFPSMGFYCTGKASREMFFSVLAEENSNYLVLSYSPGPVQTDMTEQIIKDIQDDNIRSGFLEMKANDTIVKVEQTALKLVSVLRAKQFKSGARVDYFDQ